MIEIALAVAIGPAIYLLRHWSFPKDEVTADGIAYLHMVMGGRDKASPPYSYRPLIPWLVRLVCRLKVDRELEVKTPVTGVSLEFPISTRHASVAINTASSAIASICLYFLSGSLWVPAFVLALPSLTHLTAKWPILTDLPAFALACLAALASTHHWALGIPILALAILSRESAGIYAAMWTQNIPCLMSALAVTAVIYTWNRYHCGSVDIRKAATLSRNSFHIWTPALWFSGLGILLPLLAITPANPWIWATLALAALPMLIANDRQRLLVWAAPAIAIYAIPPMNEAILPILFLAHLAIPIKYDGI